MCIYVKILLAVNIILCYYIHAFDICMLHVTTLLTVCYL